MPGLVPPRTDSRAPCGIRRKLTPKRHDATESTRNRASNWRRRSAAVMILLPSEDCGENGKKCRPIRRRPPARLPARKGRSRYVRGGSGLRTRARQGAFQAVPRPARARVASRPRLRRVSHQNTSLRRRSCRDVENDCLSGRATPQQCVYHSCAAEEGIGTARRAIPGVPRPIVGPAFRPRISHGLIR